MYKLCADVLVGSPTSVIRSLDGACIPFSPDNTDYQTFKREVAAGTPLEDPDGNVMTQEQVDEFLKEIP